MEDKILISKQSLILIVDDTLKNLQLLGNVLRKENYKICIATNGLQAIALAMENQPDLILLDVMMPELDGFETCKKLKQLEKTREIPIIFLTAKNEMEDIIKGFQVGAVDYILKPFNIFELKARVKTHVELKISKDLLREANAILQKLAVTDGLTGLLNHRAITDLLAKVFEESNRYNQVFSIAMVDIDNFKKINDEFGHPFGDEVLIKVASVIEGNLRKTDSVGRYGGEEFLIIFKHARLDDASKSMERVREKIENLKWQNENIKVTISAGLCEKQPNDNVSTIVARADELLYKAKKAGKNKIKI